MRIRSNFQEGDLSAPMSDVDTTIGFDEAPNFPAISGGDHAVIVVGEEIMYLVDYQPSGVTGVVERGKEGTAPASHSNEKWQHTLVASDLDRVDDKLQDAMGFVSHGGDPGLPRPFGFVSVTWLGWVEPLNMQDDDFWEEIPAPE